MEQLDNLDMFAAYLEEREGATLLRHTCGFGVYKNLLLHAGYLQDIWVKPEFRKKGVGREILAMAVAEAKKSNKTTLLGSTDVTANNATESAKAILSCGFQILKVEGNMIWYFMEIK